MKYETPELAEAANAESLILGGMNGETDNGTPPPTQLQSEQLGLDE